MVPSQRNLPEKPFYDAFGSLIAEGDPVLVGVSREQRTPTYTGYAKRTVLKKGRVRSFTTHKVRVELEENGVLTRSNLYPEALMVMW